MSEPTIRLAVLADVSALEELIALSARTLTASSYTSAQIEAALGSAWGVDRQLIRDGTYFVVENGNTLVACGGWSKRAALFGADALTSAEPRLLNPENEPARIRAFFVHPDWARQGIGRRLLGRCEAEAKSAGFSRAELVATLPGVRLYTACGYRSLEAKTYRLPSGTDITFVPMAKEPLPPQE